MLCTMKCVVCVFLCHQQKSMLGKNEPMHHLLANAHDSEATKRVNKITILKLLTLIFVAFSSAIRNLDSKRKSSFDSKLFITWSEFPICFIYMNILFWMNFARNERDSHDRVTVKRFSKSY